VIVIYNKQMVSYLAWFSRIMPTQISEMLKCVFATQTTTAQCKNAVFPNYNHIFC